MIAKVKKQVSGQILIFLLIYNNIAISFIDITNDFKHFMQSTVSEYENQYGIIKVSACKAEQYELIVNTLGVEIKKERIEKLKEAYPKSRTGVGIYGN